ncbi:hypothetical protein ACWGHM_13785 [Streptomyces sp. NPDC054904]|uniref:hypothetical protein n=1 Tax=unclassified Streptomyces TaxID=2593676 RepID=UPI002481B59A|nr:hypothetical protein [Streptomyces sp. Isolate_45]MDA5279542.1 hypothetical protein [Streptomyces sp. Isolate_45]
MKRFVPSKKTLGVAVAALALGAGCAFSAPVAAQQPTQHTAIDLYAMTITFSDLTGANYTGHGVVHDIRGESPVVVGDAYRRCEDTAFVSTETWCTLHIRFGTDKEASTVDLSEVMKTPETYPSEEWMATITAGSYTHEGLTGQVPAKALSRNVVQYVGAY